MKKIIFSMVFFAGCSQPEMVQTKKYAVVSVFNEIVLETEDKAKAYEAAHNLTLMGRVFSSKPIYFVKESK